MEKPKAIRKSTSFSPADVDEMLHALDLRRLTYRGEPSEAFLSIVRKVNAMKAGIRRELRARAVRAAGV